MNSPALGLEGVEVEEERRGRVSGSFEADSRQSTLSSPLLWVTERRSPRNL